MTSENFDWMIVVSYGQHFRAGYSYRMVQAIRKTTKKVAVGSTVLISYNGKQRELRVVSSSKPKIENGEVSSNAPLPRQIIGAAEGEQKIILLRDRQIKVRVEKIH